MESINLVSIPVRVLGASAVALEASSAWGQLPDRADPRVLDAFIARYPSSREAHLAFSLRHQILRADPSPTAYHRFIALYRDRVGAEQALCELYDILRKENRISGYLDFLRRYPESPLTQVAELRVHALAFAVVCERDTAEDYEAFLRAFPRAVQVQTAQDRSKARAVALAQKERDDKKAALPDGAFRNWRGDRANTLVTEWVTHFKEKFVTLWGLPPTEPTADDVTAATAVIGRDVSEKLVVQHQLDVEAAIITQVYADTDAAKDFSLASLDWLYFQHLATAIGEVRIAVEREHQELAELVKGEFVETQRLLSAGFDQLRQDIQALGGQVAGFQATVQEGLTKVGAKLDALHGDLKGVQMQLRQIDRDVNDVGQKLEQTNQALNRLDTSVREVGQGLRTLTATVRSGFDDLGEQVAGMREDVVRGFDRLGRAIEDIPQEQDGGFFGYLTDAVGGLAQFPERTGEAATGLWNRATNAAEQISRQAELSDVFGF